MLEQARDGGITGDPVVKAVAPDVPADVAAVPDPALRSALEFAVGVAAEGQKLRPPIAYPPAFKPLFKLRRLDRVALRAARKALVADSGFRDRIATVATTDLVDELGVVWLQRPEGWQQRVVELVAQAKQEAEESSAEAAIRKAERRREAAEHAAARANATLVSQHEALAREQLRREQADETATSARHEITRLRADLSRVQRDIEALRSRLESESSRAAAAEAAVETLAAALRDAETHRDEALAARLHAPARPPADSGDAASREAARALREAAAATKQLAEALATAGAALAGEPAGTSRTRERQSRRKPIAIPGGVYGDSVAATTHLLRTPRAIVIVDGYNVAKLAWPNLELADQRERCIDLLEDVARRLGSEIHVVFDGAGVIGAAAPRRRVVRVDYSPIGVSADDVIRADVAAVPATIPVIVVTNDQAIVTDVRAAGANVVASDALLAAAGRPVTDQRAK